MSAGAMRNYGSDALGSIVETVSNNATENTYQYTPYGTVLAKTGIAADPAFTWNGCDGYLATGLAKSECYVRRRHYSSSSAVWTSSDRLWPKEAPYAYAIANPVTTNDPSGLAVKCPPSVNNHKENCYDSSNLYQHCSCVTIGKAFHCCATALSTSTSKPSNACCTYMCLAYQQTCWFVNIILPKITNYVDSLPTGGPYLASSCSGSYSISKS